jgi:FAD:protein FMN transferase
VRRVEEQWGTVISVDVREPIDAAALDAVFEWFSEVDTLFSTWRTDSEICRVGRDELNRRDAHAEVQAVLARCDELRGETNGAFDVTVAQRAAQPLQPGQAPIDPSGFVKGWAVERSAAMLHATGVQRFAIAAGGDVRLGGAPPGERGWRVGIQHPLERDKVAAVVRVADAGVATSGRYERGDHVLDPRSGSPARDLLSATVVGPDLGTADAYATALMVMGPDRGLEWIRTRPGYEALVITGDQGLVRTPGFEVLRLA